MVGQEVEASDQPERTFTIVPIEGMEMIQKNFAAYGQNCDQAAEEFLRAKNLTLARRFQLIERGYVLKLKENNRETIFDHVDVHIILGSTENDEKHASIPVGKTNLEKKK